MPNGMLFDSELKTNELMEPVQVHTFASAVTDHTSYWRNRDQVVSQAVVALGHQCGLELDRLAPLWPLAVEARQIAARLPEDDAVRRHLLKLADRAVA